MHFINQGRAQQAGRRSPFCRWRCAWQRCAWRRCAWWRCWSPWRRYAWRPPLRGQRGSSSMGTAGLLLYARGQHRGVLLCGGGGAPPLRGRWSDGGATEGILLCAWGQRRSLLLCGGGGAPPMQGRRRDDDISSFNDGERVATMASDGDRIWSGSSNR
jgi:hypothetical protein